MILQEFKNDTDAFLFGIYKGKTIKSVLEYNGKYVRWLIKNNIIIITNDALKKKASIVRLYAPEIVYVYGKLTNENDIIPFGKYKGKTFKEILDINVKYLHWLKIEKLLDYSKELKSKISAMLPHREYTYSESYDTIDTSIWSAYSVMDMYYG